MLLPSSFPTPPAGAGGGISRIPVGRKKVPNQAALAESEAELCCSVGWQNTWNEKVEDGDGRALLESLSLAAINSDFILKAVASTTQNYFSIRLISSSNCKLYFFFCSYSPRVCMNLWGQWSSCTGALLFLHCGKVGMMQLPVHVRVTVDILIALTRDVFLAFHNWLQSSD